MFTFLNEFFINPKILWAAHLVEKLHLNSKGSGFFLMLANKKWVRMFYIIAFNLESLLLVILHLI